MEKLKDAAYRAAGRNFQLNSVPQLSQVLYDSLKLDQKANIKVKATVTRGAKSTSTPVVRNRTSISHESSIVIASSKFYLRCVLPVLYSECTSKFKRVRGIYAKGQIMLMLNFATSTVKL
jgi:hypothetical protein